MRKKILFISHRVPYPPNKGDKIRTFNEIKYLSQNYDIDLISFADTRDELSHAKSLNLYCSDVYLYPLNPIVRKLKGVLSLASGASISQGYFFCTAANKKIKKLLQSEHYHAIFCFSSPTAEYIFKNLPEIQNTPTAPLLMMDFCDVDSDKWDQYASKTTPPMKWVYKKESRRLLKYEAKINKHFDASVFVSSEEAKLFQKIIPNAKNVIPISNGVDFNYFSKQEDKKSPGKTLMFAGAMDYYANAEGVTWFCNKILPLIRKEEPDIKFTIVGSNPTPDVKKLERISGVTVTGFVTDIRNYYNQADICVIPLRIARGIQNKVLEAMSMGKPVISTTQAFSGINATPGKHLLLADNEKEFADEVISLLRNQDNIKRLGKNARSYIEREYAWDTCLKQLNEIIANS